MEHPAASSSPLNLKPKFAPRVVAVTGGREGIGKSCLVVNLGVLLAEMGKKVMILDADLGRADIAHFLGLTPPWTILDVLDGRISLAEVMVTGPGGIQVVPAAPGRSDFGELSQAHKLLLLDELDACAQEFDFILVDTGAGVSGNVLYFNLGAQERIIVADQEPDSVIDAYTLIKVLAGRYAEKRFKLLFNKITRPAEVHRSFEQLTKVADRFLRGSVSLEYLGLIPADEALPHSVSLQKALVAMAPHSPAGLAFAEIARSLVFQEPYTAMDGTIKFFWQNLHRRAADTFSQGDSHASELC